MIKEKLDDMVCQSLERILEKSEIKDALTESVKTDVLLKALLSTSEFQGLLTSIRGLTDNLSQVNETVLSIIDTLKIHQSAIKNVITVQDALTKQSKRATSTLDTSLPSVVSEKPSKPN